MNKTLVRYTVSILIFVAGISLLSGCMYPGGRQQEQGVSYRESVERIQSAIDAFQQDKGILPIITAGEEVPRYEKFRIDLDKLNKQGYIDQIPATAFEQGGSAYFLVINEEVDPAVKVMDLVTMQKVNDVQRLVDQYGRSHSGQWPISGGNEVYPGLHEIDLQKIRGEEHALASVYSRQPLPYLIDGEGRVYVDYAWDIMQAVDKSGKSVNEDQSDLRVLLTEQSYFVPVKSLPYAWKGGVPVPQLEK
ncbi:hypothetical protein [Paenibacillus bouchesdurhonensis]|uniref:hypothetical protein n=1 Tax=Paenibacillus bouchesdurhonensis TaxID=1870990 RepID=UPI000DA60457|nr:hypothetical protein [Paenibacillus bouchesdurhonensis]